MKKLTEICGSEFGNEATNGVKEKTLLAPLSEADRDALIALFKNEEISKTYMTPKLDSKEAEDALFSRLLALSSTEGRFVWGVYEGDALIGMLHDVAIDKGEIEVGYFIDPAQKNRGFATAALSAAIEKLFASGFSVIKAGAFKGNAASMRVMEKCGLKPTGETEIIPYRGDELECFYYAIKRHDPVILRDMRESDIEDYVRWFTVETEWSDFDAPWEEISSSEEEERKSWTEYYDSVKDMPADEPRRKFEIECGGRHIGWVSRYFDLDYVENPDRIPAVGIDIPEISERSKGVGTEALRLFIEYLRGLGYKKVYTQTWSGNARMLKVAQKLGFIPVVTLKDQREVRGGRFDAVTLALEI